MIRTDGREIVTAWIQSDADGSEAVWVSSWNGSGTETRARTQVGPASKSTWNLNLTVEGLEAWVVFDAVNATRSNELFLGRVGPAGVQPLQRLTRDDGLASKYPDLQMGPRDELRSPGYDTRDGNDEVISSSLVTPICAARSTIARVASRRRRGSRSARMSPGTANAWGWPGRTRPLGSTRSTFSHSMAPVMPLTPPSVSPAVTPGPWCPPFDRGARDSPWRGTNTGQLRAEMHEGTGEVAFTLVE